MSEWTLPDDIVEPSIEGSNNQGKSFLWESGVYDATIKLAYKEKKAAGSTWLHIELEKNGGNFGTIRDKWCIQSGDEKGNKIFYVNKETGKKQPLPGYASAKSLCLAVTGEDLDANMAKLEKKVIKLWDFKEGKHVPSEHPVVINLLNKPVKVAVTQVIENKKTQNSKGVWVVTNETKTINECKFFGNADSGKTAEEIANNKEAGQLDRWASKNTGIVIDRSSKVNAVADSAADIMESEPAGSLFKKDDEPPI